MKILFTILYALTLAACSQSASTPAAVAAADPGNSQASTSVLSLWRSGTKTLDLRGLQLNKELSADLMLTCDGSFGNSGKVNGMKLGDVMVSGNASSGYLMVGHLKYYGATDHTCADMSKEIYSYAVDGSTLTFCALNWDACGTYTLVP
jgi:hypothetical protein